LYLLAMSEIPQPTTFAYLGSMNAESYFLFGKNFQNRVISLVDCADPTNILSTPADARYLVWDGFDSLSQEWLQTNRFLPMFQATNTQNGTALLKVFERRLN
jgi:hypothetical protein